MAARSRISSSLVRDGDRRDDGVVIAGLKPAEDPVPRRVLEFHLEPASFATAFM
jgi:hypothetical protein